MPGELIDAIAGHQTGAHCAHPADLTQAVLALRGLTLAGEQFRHAVAAHFGIGISETMAMGQLSAAGPLQPRELAERIGLTPSTITSLLDRLEEAGMAHRHPHPTDRRKTVVTISDRGEAALDQVRGWMTTVVAEFDPDQLTEVTSVLNRLSSALFARTDAIRAGDSGLTA
jgi:DNA-binding MarR family transcriptional regulator